MNKLQKQVSVKHLSSPAGVADVTLGPASPERRMSGDFSKDGIPAHDTNSLDDHKERRDRYSKALRF